MHIKHQSGGTPYRRPTNMATHLFQWMAYSTTTGRFAPLTRPAISYRTRRSTSIVY